MAPSNEPNLTEIKFLMEQLSKDFKGLADDVGKLRHVLIGNGDASTSLIFQVANLEKKVDKLEEREKEHNTLKEQVQMYKNRAIGIFIAVNTGWVIFTAFK